MRFCGGVKLLAIVMSAQSRFSLASRPGPSGPGPAQLPCLTPILLSVRLARCSTQIMIVEAASCWRHPGTTKLRTEVGEPAGVRSGLLEQ
jgi:hypothetical protein